MRDLEKNRHTIDIQIPGGRSDSRVGAWTGYFNRKHLLKFKDVAKHEKYIEQVTVPTMTVSNLLSKHKIGRIDLLYIDTEGYDYKIIRMAFETGLFPYFINYEHEQFSAWDNLDCKLMLKNNGYRFVIYGRAILASK